MTLLISSKVTEYFSVVKIEFLSTTKPAGILSINLIFFKVPLPALVTVNEYVTVSLKLGVSSVTFLIKFQYIPTES